MPLPSITTIQVATVPLAAYLSRSAAILAAAGGSSPLPEINFMNATVILGDGNVGGSGPTVPAISTLQASGAVTHEVWRGTIVQAVTIDPANSNQVDILCVVPAVDGSGAEIGPFWATEFIVTDELGTAMLAGTTLMPKLVTANGSAVDLAFIASVGLSLGTVVLTPPSAAFCTMAQVEAKWNAHLPTAVTPLTQTDATASDGWTERVFGVHLAAKPADAVTDAGSIAALGATRAASDAEFAAGTAAGASTFKTPYPTLEQIAAALLALRTLPSTSVPGTTTVYRNHGTYTFTPPAGVTRVYVKIWGAGGGGGGLTFNTTASGAGAGGGGGYAEGAVNVTPGVGVTVTVGAGGAGGAGSGNATGGAGGTSSFGAAGSATGGGGGVGGNGGAGGAGGSGSGLAETFGGVAGGLSYTVGGGAVMQSQGGSSFGFPGNVPIVGVASGAGGIYPGQGANGGSVFSSGQVNNGGTGHDGQIIVFY